MTHKNDTNWIYYRNSQILEVDGVVDFLLNEAQGFKESIEYLNIYDEGNEDLTGVVLAGFGRFLIRTKHANAFATLEKLLLSGSRKVVESICVDVFEVRHEPDDILQGFRENLLPKSREIFEASFNEKSAPRG